MFVLVQLDMVDVLLEAACKHVLTLRKNTLYIVLAIESAIKSGITPPK